MTEENTQPKMTEEQFVDRLTKCYNTMWECEADLKDLLEEAKDAEVEDVSLIKEIVKAKVWKKLGNLIDKTKAKLEKIEELGL